MIEPSFAQRQGKAPLMSGGPDLYNPAEEGIEAAAAIPDGRHPTTPSVQGDVAAMPGFKPAYPEFIDAAARGMMRNATNTWKATSP